MQQLRQSMSWAHTWTGLLLGWVLYFMFLTGSTGYYDREIDRWTQPEHPAPVEIMNTATAFEAAIDKTLTDHPNASEFYVFLPGGRSAYPFVRVFGSEKNSEGKTERFDVQLFEDGTPIPEARDTTGGQTLYSMHWTFHYVPRIAGELFAGLAAIFMFTAIVSGIITHKKIFVDFFTLRLAKGQRSWLDSHNVISVMTLPFQIMITFSGILLVVTTFFLPIFVAQYGYDENTTQTVAEEVYNIKPPKEPTGVLAERVAIAPLVARFEEAFPDEPLQGLLLKNPGDAVSEVQLSGAITHSILRETPSLTFDAATGELIDTHERRVDSSMAVTNVLEGLHEGLFAGPVLRILYFGSGLLGAGMVATGLVLWTKKRRQKLRGDEKAERNLLIIERMNVGVVAGLPIAIAGFFYANRLLPLGMDARAEWEIHVLFLTWLAVLIHSLARKPSAAWTEQLTAASAVYVFLPILNILTTSKHLGATLPLPWRAGDFELAGVDLWFLVIGAGFAYAAQVSRKKQALPKKSVVRPSPINAAGAPAE
ncbi:MAG: PepSY-associated TM helix domain-containing protein [Pseudomonadota bacterium]